MAAANITHKLTNFSDVDALLKQYVPPLQKFQQVYTLVNMRALMSALGNPQEAYRVIHVAGTSGKTSTSYYIASLLQKTGRKIGLTVSPHVGKVSERIQINLKPLDDAVYFQELQEFVALVDESGIKPTYFELLVAFAYREFARQKVDYAIVEVGLGGLLDGTNVIGRNDKISVITDIGLDHVDILGNSLPEIAQQKAGIILPDSDVFCFHQSEEVDSIFQATADERHARLHTQDYKPKGVTSSLPLFQQRNWALADQVVDFILQRDGIRALTDDKKKNSTKTYIPARMEIIEQGEHTLVLDAAHNPQKMQALIPSLKARFPDQKFAVLMSLLQSKDMRLSGVLEELLPITSYLIVTGFVAGQDLRKNSTAPQAIVSACHARGFDNVVIINDTLEAYAALKNRPEKLRMITGSLYLLHDIHRMIGTL